MRLAAAELLRRQHRVRAAALVGALSRSVAPGLGGSAALIVVTSGSCGHRASDAASVSAICVTACSCPAGSAPPSGARRSVGFGRRRPRIDQQRQRVGDRRAAVAALGKRTRAAEHEQPAAALVDEVGDDLELVARERGGFDAAENQAAILEQLLARRREAGRELVRALRLVMNSRMNLLSAVRCSATTSRFLSSATARRRNRISNRGSPSK